MKMEDEETIDDIVNENESTQSEQTFRALVRYDLRSIKKDVHKINDKLDKEYATKSELEIVRDEGRLNRNILFGFIGLIVIGFFGAVISFFIRTPQLP